MSVTIKPTSEISNLSVKDTAASVTLKLSVNGVLLPKTGDLVAPTVDGVATFYNIREIIENQLEETGKSMAEINISAFGSAEIRMDKIYAVYLKHRFDGSFPAFLRRNFLSTRKSKRLTADASERITYIVADTESAALILRITYVTAAGEVRTGKVSVKDVVAPSNTAVCESYDVDYAGMNSLATSNFADYGGKVLAVSIQLGERYYSIYFPDFAPSMSLMFVNAFNAIETCQIDCQTTTKSKVDSSTAVGIEQTWQYDRRLEKTYETETSALSMPELRWFEQILNSGEVALVDFSNKNEEPWADSPRIIITDSTCEVSDSDAELQRIKFTWQFCDNNPELGIGYVPTTPDDGIFTDEYDIIFK